jgi:5-methylcytosine-specific restriction endonuclease McrA
MDDVYQDTPETAPRRPLAPTAGQRDRAALSKIRDSQAYRKHRETFRFRAKHAHMPDGSIGQPCWLCGKRINYNLEHPVPWAWEMDHVVPMSERPELALSVPNCRSAHSRCNNTRGVRDPDPDGELGVPTEDW